MSGLNGRVARLEQRTGEPGGAMFVTFGNPPVRVLMATAETRWKWRDVPPDTPIPPGAVVQRYGLAMSPLWDAL